MKWYASLFNYKDGTPEFVRAWEFETPEAIAQFVKLSVCALLPGEELQLGLIVRGHAKEARRYAMKLSVEQWIEDNAIELEAIRQKHNIMHPKCQFEDIQTLCHEMLDNTIDTWACEYATG